MDSLSDSSHVVSEETNFLVAAIDNCWHVSDTRIHSKNTKQKILVFLIYFPVIFVS